jgi:phosphatidylglycerophosphate synthase
MTGVEDSRRPLASRNSAWAPALASRIARTPVTPNMISVVAVVFALIGSAAMARAPIHPWLLLVGAATMQLRLLCNLLDGMVAVEGGKASATGALYNEVPDRIADALFLVSFGYAVGLPWLGFVAAILAVGTAYLRAFGAALGLGHDFSGPMAKQQRMAALTGGGLLGFVELLVNGTLVSAQLVLALVVAGTAWTCVRRTLRMAARLKGRPS